MTDTRQDTAGSPDFTPIIGFALGALVGGATGLADPGLWAMVGMAGAWTGGGAAGRSPRRR